ncbi:putative membrane protein, partial [Chlamydia psittaci 08-2626_L3]
MQTKGSLLYIFPLIV